MRPCIRRPQYGGAVGQAGRGGRLPATYGQMICHGRDGKIGVLPSNIKRKTVSEDRRASPSQELVDIAKMLNAGIFLVPLLYAAAGAAVGPSPTQIKNLVTFGDSYTDVVSP